MITVIETGGKLFRTAVYDPEFFRQSSKKTEQCRLFDNDCSYIYSTDFLRKSNE
jgi:hypothetical protein